MSDCPMFGRWRGCQFEPRYDDRKLPRVEHQARGLARGRQRLASERIYVRDVCVRCGRTIEREGAAR